MQLGEDTTVPEPDVETLRVWLEVGLAEVEEPGGVEEPA